MSDKRKERRRDDDDTDYVVETPAERTKRIRYTDDYDDDFVVNEEKESLPAREWDPQTLPENCSMVMLAKRRSGKTHMLRSFLYTIKDRYDDAYLFCGTKDFQVEEYAFVSKDHQYDYINEEKIQELYDEQERLTLRKLANPGVKVKIPHIIMIFDDIISDALVRTSKVFQDLFTRGRHIGISVVVLAQDFAGKYGIPIVCRRNCDCAVAFNIDAEYDRRAMYGQYCSKKNLKAGSRYASRISAVRYQASVFDLCNTTSRDSPDYIFKYMAPEKLKQFKIGVHRSEDLPLKDNLDRLLSRLGKPSVDLNVQIRKRPKLIM